MVFPLTVERAYFPSPSTLRLVARPLTEHEIPQYLELIRRGPAPVEASERWLLAAPQPFLLAPAYDHSVGVFYFKVLNCGN